MYDRRESEDREEDIGIVWKFYAETFTFFTIKERTFT